MSIPLLVQFILCPVVLISLLVTTAPYGRHHRPGWGPCLPARVAWFLMELPALLVVPGLVLSSPARAEPGAWIPVALWLLHYGYRTLVFPALMRPSGKTFPILLVGFAIGFNLLNGYNNGTALIANGFAGASTNSIRFLAGFLLFVAGFAVHCQADHIIRMLRRPGDTGYRPDYVFAFAFSNTDLGGSSVPGPASLGILMLGAAAWVARRRSHGDAARHRTRRASGHAGRGERGPATLHDPLLTPEQL